MKTNLLIFITPTVVTKKEVLEEISLQKMEAQKNINSDSKKDESK